jgi:hypothetical protein
VEAREARTWQGYCSGYAENTRPNDSDARTRLGPKHRGAWSSRILSPVAVDQPDRADCACSIF